MLTGDIVDSKTGDIFQVSFFEDDTVETIRAQIAKSLNSHPDRLFIQIGLRLPPNYYTNDDRHKEMLYDRFFAFDKEHVDEYQTRYTVPATNYQFTPMLKREWMLDNQFIHHDTEFVENRIFGVPESKSYILSLTNITSPKSLEIASSKYPIPENATLFNSLYNPTEFVNFTVIRYESKYEHTSRIYFPLLTANTPEQLSIETITLLDKNTKFLNSILNLEITQPDEVNIIRTRFVVKWVKTDFGSSVLTKFEQMLYGLTVSETIPYIGLFTSIDNNSRHKFYTNDTKTPYLDMSMWKRWWSIKPSRNIPTLILLRGKSSKNFDRISITEHDMIVTAYRPENTTDTQDDIYKTISKWITNFDSIIPFLDVGDIDRSRWIVQDLSYYLRYSRPIKSIDLLRFKCLSNIFAIANKSKLSFSIMRTDHLNNGISAVDLKILNMMRDSSLTSKALSDDLGISIREADILIARVKQRVEDDENIFNRAFHGYPTIKLTGDLVIVSSVTNLELSKHYAGILRFVVSQNTPELDKICPKRVERIKAESAKINVSNEDIQDFGDLFDYIQQEEEVVENEPSTATEESLQEDIEVTRQKSQYGYFKSLLEKFDPETFKTPDYPKKCEKSNQPVALTTRQIADLSRTDYGIGDLPQLETSSPDGVFICPEYWCMTDNLPLRETQLINSKCPVCNGKIQTNSRQNKFEYSVIKRPESSKYPRYINNYFSTTSGRELPCCFSTNKPKKLTGENLEDKFYILSELKNNLKELRLSFIPQYYIDTLQLEEKYTYIKTSRLSNGLSGFFLVGLGVASTNLPTLLNLNVKIPTPREAIDSVLKCSFLNTWKRIGTTNHEEIEQKLKTNNFFRNDTNPRKYLTGIISGIDEAFQSNSLTFLENLEYTSIVLKCDVFLFDIVSNSIHCVFYSKLVRPRTRGIIVTLSDSQLNIISYCSRVSNDIKYRANIYEKPFRENTYTAVERLRNLACMIEIPNYNDALEVMRQTQEDITGFKIILDPFGNGQAVFIANTIIVPFRSVPLRDTEQEIVNGYADISDNDLPDYESMKSILEVAKKVNSGYAFKDNLFNSKNQIVEILLECGLRIPVFAINSVEEPTTEIIETLRDNGGETDLVFGSESQEIRERERDISYSSEIYDFMLFQLSGDLETEDYSDLREDVSSNDKSLKRSLQAWFNTTFHFLKLDKTKQFVSKIRTKCDDKCKGVLCGWVGNQCKANIDSSIDRDKIFNRLLGNIRDNQKLRSAILDGRLTPFFSTVLYLKLPTEIIITDREIDEYI